MERTVCVLQPNYIPWKGYFDLIGHSDILIVLDDVQFTKNDWRNRNLIKTPKGVEWVSIPVGKKINRLIKDVQVTDSKWQRKHWSAIKMNYSRAKFSEEILNILEPIYVKMSFETLNDINVTLIKCICNFFDIKTKIISSSQFSPRPTGSDGVLALCKAVGATRYVSGGAAKAYLREMDFLRSGIDIEWFDYSNYPEYMQLWGPFEHRVSIIDLMFNCGALARDKLKLSRSSRLW